MTLREKQSLFALNLSKLIAYAYDIGYEITLGEVYRTQCQQYLYFEGRKIMKIGSDLKLAVTKPKSKTMNSKHRDKLACDINLFKDGKYLTDKESFKPLAEFWKGLNEKNVSGYNWGWDYNHYQMS